MGRNVIENLTKRCLGFCLIEEHEVKVTFFPVNFNNFLIQLPYPPIVFQLNLFGIL